MSNSKTVMSQAANSWAGPTYIEDVFSTYLYTGTGSTQTITNGIDLAGEGGLVWLKGRSIPQGHTITDTIRGSNFVLQPNTTDAQVNTGSLYVTAFNADGFSIGTGSNTSGQTFASWTFRKAPRFFDVVTYTGNGSNQQIAHNLGVAPGCIIVKNTGATANWCVYHRGTNVSAFNQRMQLNTTDAVATSATAWNGTVPTDTEFSVGNFFNTNASGNTYVAYLFAHDPLGPSEDGSDGLIACGSYTGNGSTTGPVVDLGWEPQWLLVKRSDSTGDWNLIDNMRGFTVGGTDAELNPNLSNVENTGTFVSPTATGFQLNTTDAGYNASGGTYIYIAIRRGPMRVPESGTEVFSVGASNVIGSGTLTIGNRSPDLVVGLGSRTSPTGFRWSDRLRGFLNVLNANTLGSTSTNPSLNSSSTSAELTSGNPIGVQNVSSAIGFARPILMSTTSSSGLAYFFRRAPGFFDVVAYTGNGTAGRTVPHNLGVAPEMMIVKRRTGDPVDWAVYHSATGATKRGRLNTNDLFDVSSTHWNNTSPTDTVFTLGGATNTSAQSFIAYLFATLPGVSKVFSVTKSSGSNAAVACGFTSGPRFVLLKRTDSTGDWYVWDTARGIVAGNDPYLLLNSTAAEVTNTDFIDPTGNGFTIVDGGLANGDYIGLAIA